MRRTTNTLVYFISYLLLFLALASTVALAEPTLQIHIYDEVGNELETFSVYDGATYRIAITTTNTTDLLTDVTITFPWGINTTTITNPLIVLDPEFYSDYSPFFTITAERIGYISAQKTITISNHQLNILLESTSIKEQTTFLVTIVDENNDPVSDVTILFLNNTATIETESTDKDGQVHLTAPSVDADCSYKITATMTGFQPSTQTITIKANRPVQETAWYDSFIDYAPILFSIFAVLFAVWLVDLRTKKMNIRPSKNKTQKNDTPEVTIHKSPTKKQVMQPKQESIEEPQKPPTKPPTTSNRIEELHFTEPPRPRPQAPIAQSPFTTPQKPKQLHYTSNKTLEQLVDEKITAARRRRAEEEKNTN